MAPLRSLLALATSYALLVAATPRSSDLSSRADAKQAVVNRTTCDKKDFAYEQLAGYGLIPSDARDKFGDTLGGYGSAIALDRKAWKKTANGSYTGLLWALPDRGWYVDRLDHSL